MPYTDFRLIAYEVPTVVGTGPADVVSGWDPGAECPAVARAPVPDDVVGDARIRLKRLAAVADRALTQVQGWPDAPTTLKVLVAPEFYFRPPGTANADDPYQYATYSVADRARILQALNAMFADPAFANWLLVCGTILWNTKAPPTRQDAGATLYYNTATVVRGGVANSLAIVEKNLPSHVDGLPKLDGERYAAPGDDALLARSYYARWYARQLRVIDVGGRTIGLEICLDHASSAPHRVLRRVVEDWSFWESTPDPLIDLHVLVAGGMNLEGASIAARVGGYFVRNDGASPPGVTSQVARVTNYLAPSGPAAPTNSLALPAFTPLTALLADVLPEGPLRVPNAPSPLPQFRQTLRYFPVRPLP